MRRVCALQLGIFSLHQPVLFLDHVTAWDEMGRTDAVLLVIGTPNQNSAGSGGSALLSLLRQPPTQQPLRGSRPQLPGRQQPGGTGGPLQNRQPPPPPHLPGPVALASNASVQQRPPNAQQSAFAASPQMPSFFGLQHTPRGPGGEAPC